jgi:hypothetical protein
MQKTGMPVPLNRKEDILHRDVTHHTGGRVALIIL